MRKWETLGKVKSRKPIKKEEILEILLKNRGIKSEKEKEKFLNPKLSFLTPKEAGIDTVQLGKALGRIKKALSEEERIIVFGDYDVDGIAGTAILWETLHRENGRTMPYIPHRIDEGYGLSEKGIDNLLKLYPDVSLIITVDNGIVASGAVDYANNKRIDVIITDHHLPHEEHDYPNALATVHTVELCGAGVAYILSREIKEKLFNEKYSFEKDEHLELAAIATIADLVVLKNLNRVIVKFGIEKLCRSKRPGVIELFKEAACDIRTAGVYEVGRVISPRLNATGRIESAMDSLRLLCTRDIKRAKDLARKIGSTNKVRQDVMFTAIEHAKEKVKTQNSKLKSLIFVSDESYQQGVIGLVAGRLVDEFYKPSIVVSIGKTFSKASARSVSGFNIIEFIRSTGDSHLVDAGGHPMAAGFTVETAKLLKVQKLLEKRARELLKDEDLVKKLKIDTELPSSLITFDIFDSIQKLSPFGMGNPEPIFLTKGLKVENFRTVGEEGRHLKLRLSKEGIFFSAIGFRMGERASEIQEGSSLDVVFTLSSDEWDGKRRLQLKLKDLRQSS